MPELSKSLSEQVEGVLRLVLDTLPAPILEFNRNLNITYANRAAQRLTGYVMGELQDGRFSLESLIAPEDRTRLRETLYRVLALEALDRVEVTLLHKDGATVRVRFNVEVLFRRAAVYGIRVSLTDQYGSVQAAEPDVQSQTMETIGRLALCVMHDLNNKLQVITGYADLGLSRCSAGHGNGAGLGDYFSIIRDMARQCGGMASEVLLYSKRKAGTMQRTDVHGIIAHVMKLLGCTVGRGIKVMADFNTLYSNVLCNPQQLEDALLNVLYNARDAMPEGGRLCIATHGRTITLPRSSVYGFAVNPGQYLIISISDTGHGMDDTTKSRIFDPFFTTKESARGTGLGLANVYETIKAHHGFIEVTSARHQGSLFEIYLPLADTGVGSRPPQSVVMAE